MALNLLPMPPLDGGRIAVSLLPNRLAYALSRVEPYGFFILIGCCWSTGALELLPAAAADRLGDRAHRAPVSV